MHNDEMYASWPLKFVRGAGPRYRQIADFIAGAVADNRMQPGDRLPPQRGLAQHLGVDLTTVTRAYAEAGQRGLIEPRGPLGTFIARPTDEPLLQMLDLGMNMPPLPLGCDLQDLLRRGLAKAMERHDVGVMMTYHQAGGGQAEREAGAEWLAQSVGRVDPDRVLVCPGAQAALAAVMLAYSRPGDGIVAEPLVYPGLLTAAQLFGRRILVADTDADGMTPAGLERACREGGRLVYLNPTLQNPTAHTMSVARRRDLLRAAAACGVRIIEDDPYSLFLHDAPPALASLAPASVFYIATLAKTLTPGLRTAFVLTPDLDGRRNVLAAMRSFAVMAAPLMGVLTTQWIASGMAQQILDGVRAEAHARQRLARQLLPGPFPSAAAGIHLWQTLPDRWTASDLERVARDEGLSVTSSEVFHQGPGAPNAIRISLGSIPDRQELGQALEHLAGLVRRRPRGLRDVIV